MPRGSARPPWNSWKARRYGRLRASLAAWRSLPRTRWAPCRSRLVTPRGTGRLALRWASQRMNDDYAAHEQRDCLIAYLGAGGSERRDSGKAQARSRDVARVTQL